MSLTFSTKAQTLAKVSATLSSARVLPLIFFNLKDWISSRDLLSSRIQNSLGLGPWIVRSSCSKEDNKDFSNAGAFLSIPNIYSPNLATAIDQVFSSYGNENLFDEVLVQPMIKNVKYSGVAFSHDPNTLSPYRVINWSEGENTSIVTSGSGGSTWHQACENIYAPPKFLVPVLSLITELLHQFGETPLDIEFAITDEQILWLLQVRPLILKAPSEDSATQTKRLKNIAKKVERGMQPHPLLMGKTTVYGVMPDWNPAEIIGIRPKPLALSLYKELITDSIWAYQRHNYGYRNLRSFPLMEHFYGLPYIDVRLSFNSFIPAILTDDIASRLVDLYIKRLLDEPALHDKVEFEIVYSCYTLDLPERLSLLKNQGFSLNEISQIESSLRSITNEIVNPMNGLWKADAAKLDKLQSRRKLILNSKISQIEKIYWLLEDGKRYGTLPFAGLARAGFIAIQFLKSLVSVGVFTTTDYENFLASISTVTGKLSQDKALLCKDDFLKLYGHLRPGTYDIQSPRYDEAPNMYFNWDKRNDVCTPTEFHLSLSQIRKISELLKRHALSSDVVALFDFLQSAIELREFAKFEFTHNLSDALKLLTEFGVSLGISRADMSFCDINAIKELYFSAADPLETILLSINHGKRRYEETLRVTLPPLITSPQDVWGFIQPESSPNFITQKKVNSHIADPLNLEKLKDGIVCIPSADPGFDWLFSHSIGGLITAWGGSNSHMAIRAGELGIPAIIGCGEPLYKKYSESNQLYIDCANCYVEIVR